MNTIRTILTGAALTGALAAALAATPAQAATTPTTTSAATATASTASTASTATASYDRHGFGKIWSGYSDDEDRHDRSYFTGYWYSHNGYYYFKGDLFDRDRDNDHSYIDFQWHDDNGWHEKIYRGGRYGVSHFSGKFRKGGFDDFRIRVGEGTRGDYDWGQYRYLF
ncbi:hypothetical protein [Sphaerisporangium dianthi]|uniref:Uncharacterized protein n=1 Tax=Sphaerisporangium dianthi TaxID=1436120 RepID=A0ABV9CW31_9ACTN